MTAIEKQKIREIQKNLLQIKITGRARINLTQYKNLGLVKVMYKNITQTSGQIESVFDRLVLTQKADQYLKVVI
jgi:hypothetical protein